MYSKSGLRTAQESYLTPTISEIDKYFSIPEKFNQFADLVKIDNDELDHSTIKEISEQIKNLNMIMPLKKLCIRYINEVSLVNYLHFQFILLTLKLKCPMEALEIAESVAIPYKFKKGDYEKYQFNCYLVFVELGLFSKAYKKLRSLAEIMERSEYTSEYYNYAIHYLLMSRQQNKKYINENLFERLLVFQEALKFKEISQDEQIQRRKVISNLIGFVKGKNFDQMSIMSLRQSDRSGRISLILEEIEDQNAIKMRQNVAQFKSDQYERIKTRQILNSPLSNPQTLRAINKFQIMARYNSKESILYFNYDNQNQSEINGLISRCYELTKALKKIKEVGSQALKPGLNMDEYLNYKRSGGSGRGYEMNWDD